MSNKGGSLLLTGAGSMLSSLGGSMKSLSSRSYVGRGDNAVDTAGDTSRYLRLLGRSFKQEPPTPPLRGRRLKRESEREREREGRSPNAGHVQSTPPLKGRALATHGPRVPRPPTPPPEQPQQPQQQFVRKVLRTARRGFVKDSDRVETLEDFIEYCDIDQCTVYTSEATGSHLKLLASASRRPSHKGERLVQLTRPAHEVVARETAKLLWMYV